MALVSYEETVKLIRAMVAQIKVSDFKPDTIVALSIGGFPTAAALAKQLNISGRNVTGLPAYKDKAGNYHLDETLVRLGDFTGCQVLVVDEASRRGLLAKTAVDAIEQHGGVVKSCVLWLGAEVSSQTSWLQVVEKPSPIFTGKRHN